MFSFFHKKNNPKNQTVPRTEKRSTKKVVLLVLDGLGISANLQGNALANAKTPNLDTLLSQYPTKLLQTSGFAVGLPWKEVGNSEVGHLTIGTGQIIQQNLPKIDQSFKDGTFANNQVLVEAIQNCRNNNSAFHIMGLYGSKGVVHSNKQHLYKLLQILKTANLTKVYIHIFTDGRDSPTTDGLQMVERLQELCTQLGIGQIASISGRKYAMDRNKNYDRTLLTYRAMTDPTFQIKTSSPIDYLRQAYARQETDEFLQPAQIIDSQTNTPLGLVNSNDSLFFYNYRADRAIQISEAFAKDDFQGFQRQKIPLYFATMVQYEDNLPAKVVIEKQKVRDCLTKIISDQNRKVLKVAETEKYAHVTYFFNGGAEQAFANEERLLVPSRNVSFDQIPEMQAFDITKKVLDNIKLQKHDLIVTNFANPDMVGHTGNLNASVKALEIVDQCIGQIYNQALKNGYVVLIVADHGNCDEMLNPYNGKVLTTHSNNPVFFTTVDNDLRQNIAPLPKHDILNQYGNMTPNGFLIDVAPEILTYLNISVSQEMTGVVSSDITSELSRMS